MILAFILGCEIMFWVLVVGGAAVRYLLGWRRVSTVLLLLVPVLDVVLLTAIALHLREGGTADWTHGLGALYLGFTVAFGHSLIKWIDVRFAQRFAGGPAPVPRPKVGGPAVRHEARTWVQTTLACAIGAVALVALIAFTGDADRTSSLTMTFQALSTIMLINTALAVWGIADAVLRRDRSAERAEPVPSDSVGT